MANAAQQSRRVGRALVLVLLFSLALLAAAAAGGFTAHLPLVSRQPTLSPTATWPSTPTSTPGPSATATRSAASSATPGQTFTPCYTPTPPPAISLEYTTVVTSHQQIQVSVHVENIRSPTLCLYRLAAAPDVIAIQALDAAGNPLQHTLDSPELGPHPVQRLTVQALSGTSVSITYDLDLAAQSEWVSNESYIAISEELVFFQPMIDDTPSAELRFHFITRSDWRVVTRLTPNAYGFAANLRQTFLKPAGSLGYRRFTLGGPLAFGDFEVVETRFGNVRLLAAYPRGDPAYGQDALYVPQLYAYYESVLGRQGRDFADLAQVYVFIPTERAYSSGSFINGVFEYSHAEDDRHLGHEMFHMWLGCGLMWPDAWRFLHVPCWFQEGTIEFLSVSAHRAVGAFTAQREMEWRIGFFNTYTSTLRGTANDVPLTECDSLGPGHNARYDACEYAKAHSAFWLMDQVLRRATGGAATYPLLVAELFGQNAEGTEHMVTLEEFRDTASRLSGLDFRPFFEAYVSGTVAIPLDVRDGQLIVQWDQVVAMPTHALPTPTPTPRATATPSLPIVVDGSGCEWAAIPPVREDAAGDSLAGASTDLRAVHLVVDDAYVYVLVRASAPLTRERATIAVNLDLRPGDPCGMSHEIGSNINSDSTIWVWPSTPPCDSPQGYQVGGAAVRWGDVLEVRIPRASLPAHEYVRLASASIWTTFGGSWTYVDVM